MREPRTVLIPGDRVQLTAIGRDKLPRLAHDAGGDVVAMKPGGGLVSVRLDGARAAVSFPVKWWQRAAFPPPVRQEERPEAGCVAGTPTSPRTPVATPAPVRAPLLVTCLTCLKQMPLELRDARAPGPFVMPKCCGDWMQLLPLTRSRPVPLMTPPSEKERSMRMRLGLLALLLVLLPTWAAAQANPITGYVAQYYNAGATQPLTQSDTILPAAVTCGVTPKLAAAAVNSINPTTLLWDDPASPTTADCRAALAQGASLFSLPLGATYEGVIVTVTAGGSSPPSNRASFTQAPLPAARTGLRATR